MLRLLVTLSIAFVISFCSHPSMASVDAECRNAFCSPGAHSIGIGTEESLLVGRYGEGLVTEVRATRSVLNRTHCYFLPERNIWVEFVVDYHHSVKDEGGRVEEMFLSREELCEKKYVPTNSPGRFSSTKSISIGDPESIVHQRHGKPSFRVNTVERERQTPSLKGSRLGSRYGTIILRYLPASANDIATEFFLENGVVHSLWVGFVEE
jgi:hypothetical protein